MTFGVLYQNFAETISLSLQFYNVSDNESSQRLKSDMWLQVYTKDTAKHLKHARKETTSRQHMCPVHVKMVCCLVPYAGMVCCCSIWSNIEDI